MAATIPPPPGGGWTYSVPLDEKDGNVRSRSAQRQQQHQQQQQQQGQGQGQGQGHHHPHPHQHHNRGWTDQERGREREQEPEQEQEIEQEQHAPDWPLQTRSSAWDLQSDSEQTKRRRSSMRQVNSTAVRKRSRNAPRDKQAQSGGKQMTAAQMQEQVDDSAWIHRDKLAQIEIQELAEAGIYVRPSRRSQSAGPRREEGSSRSRTASRAGAGRKSRNDHPPQDVGYDDDSAAAYPVQDPPSERQNAEPSHFASPVRSPHEAEAPPPPPPPVTSSQQRTEAQMEHHQAEVRTSDEPAYGQQARQQHSGRPGTSRIPISRVSPAPVPQAVVGRDSPLPRSRAGSQSMGGNWDELQYARKARSASISSQVLLDSDLEGTRNSPPGSKDSSMDGKPSSKARAGQKTTPKAAHGGATTSPRPGSSSGKRVLSGASSKRPASSNGHKQRPSISHCPPEGDPPWIASMYKPDPRLPPDQQMLPTHAKRMMQEQWEKEGKTGTVYDKDFKLLNDEDLSRKRPDLALTVDSQDPDYMNVPNPVHSPRKSSLNSPVATGNGWPMSPKSDGRKSESGSVRPGTSGGYKTTPTITSTPTLPPPSAGRSSPLPLRPSLNPPQSPMPRVPALDEKEESTPTKACCVVM